MDKREELARNSYDIEILLGMHPQDLDALARRWGITPVNERRKMVIEIVKKMNAD